MKLYQLNVILNFYKTIKTHLLLKLNLILMIYYLDYVLHLIIYSIIKIIKYIT